MILKAEELRQKAHELALTHIPNSKRQWLHNPLWRDFYTEVQNIRAFTALLRDATPGCTQPAEEWLLDNAEFIEEQVLVVKRLLSEAALRFLPHVRRTGRPRVLAICADFLNHADGSLELETFTSFVNAYQEVSVLSIAEVWAFPLVLRMAMIRRLGEVMRLVRERRVACALVQRLLERIEPAKPDPGMLKEALEEAGQDIPLSGPVIAHLIKHLREWSEDQTSVRQWLICKLENDTESLDKIVSYEYRLQAAYQVTTGNIIGSLRHISRWDWRDTFENICLTEQTLRREKTGIYKLLDYTSRDSLRRRVEKLAGRLKIPENLVAKEAVELAAGHIGPAGGANSREELPRRAFVAYYLQEPAGVAELIRALKICGRPGSLPELGIIRHAGGIYFSVLTGLFIAFLLGFAAWIAEGAGFTPWRWVFVLLVLALPASEWAVTAAHWLIERLGRTEPLLRYDFSDGIPAGATAMVVIPVIWTAADEVQELADRLELHYLANRDPHIHFALLADFADAGTEELPQDSRLLAAARAGIEELNRAYAKPGESTFHFFQRRRLWNPGEGVWMGWERKRGKLAEFVELLSGRSDTTFRHVCGDASVLPRVRYVITLDADTRLPTDTARQMIGTIHLPYNRPRLNHQGTRVSEGYGVLQPRIGVSHEAAWRTRFAFLWSAEPGMDPYAFAVSDPYQDGLGQGIFTGKGIFDVSSFAKVLSERIPENLVLSHDLLEGGFLRAGLLSDIELIDDHPATFNAYQKRQHRWVRGDWQLLPWLFAHVRNRRGNLVPVDLPLLTRWQIADNLRRSLMQPALLAILFLSMIILPGSPPRWAALALATLFLPVIRQLATITRIIRRPGNFLAAAGQAMVNILALPFQSVVLLDAIGRTIYRLLVSKRHLLQWVSAAAVERRSQSRRCPALLGMPGGFALILLFALAASFAHTPAMMRIGYAAVAAWAIAPLAISRLNRPLRRHGVTLDAGQTEELGRLARDIWSFFADFVTIDSNWLPPDNVQTDPPKGVAHRTSPTNIGLYLAGVLAARDLGLIGTPDLMARTDSTITTVERLEKWHGHLYNWYDTVSLEPLPPRYISTVDSGNFVTYLVAVKEGLAEWIGSTEADDEKCRQLIRRIEALIEDTDFRRLYDRKTALFTLGYHGGLKQKDQILYDLLASEARQASFIALALGQVPAAHWYALGRTMTRVGKRCLLLSWSGTMFEYLMPALVLRTYRNTVWESTFFAVVRRQLEYARQRGIPFGISESGYFAFDHQLNYQYKAFGVPGLGFKRGLEQDLVVSPYATILALPFAPREVTEALREMEALGGRGKYGYYEAIDFTAERLPQGRKHAVIRSFMAHHQGMSLISLANLLSPSQMYVRFHRDKRVRATELLLQERLPVRPGIIKHPALARAHLPAAVPAGTGPRREYLTADTPSPEVCILSNGTMVTMVTNSGSGFCRYKGLAVSRWREDPVLDNWGHYMYIRDVNRNAVWSPTFQPCRVLPSKQRAQFSLDRATFMRVDGEIQSSLEICVSPEWDAEVRRLTLTNAGNAPVIMEVTTFLELVLDYANADDLHPAFSKLFCETEYDPETQCLLARRRPRREKDLPLWAAHTLLAASPTLGPAEYETDRASFIGRGHSLAQPAAISTRLRGKTGSVSDPAFVMRRQVKIEPGEQVRLYAITAVAGTREEALAIIGHFTGDQAVERTFQMSWNRSRIELRHLHLTAAEAIAYHIMAGQVLYTPPFRQQRKESIRQNIKGPSGLWAFGISGDLPIILARISHKTDIQFIVRLFTGHEYLLRLGISFDLVVLNESAGGYSHDLQEALLRAAEYSVPRHGAGAGGIAIINAHHLPNEDIILLMSAARLILRADGPSLRAQIKLPPPDLPCPEPLAAAGQPGRDTDETLALGQDPAFFNGLGGFSPDGREYRILLKNGHHLPAPWINVLANRRFGCLVSELGTGHTWWRNSREFKLTPWSNDPVLDTPGEACYLRDEKSGEFWSATPAAHGETLYSVTHGRGYTVFAHQKHHIAAELTIFVPLDDPVKVLLLRLQNKTKETRFLSVTFCAEWVLGVRRQDNAPYIITDWDEKERLLLARNGYQETFSKAAAFLGVYPAADIPAESLSWTADRNEFLGRNHTWEDPAAMRRLRLSGATGPQYDACGAVQAKLTLEAEAEQTVCILLGCEQTHDAATQLGRRYSQAGACDDALRQVREFWDNVLEQIQISTPCREMDILLNGWLLYQTLACRILARSAFYQAGGAYGFRDQLQDSLALLHTRPDLTRAQILLHTGRQYREGDVQHWWHEETGQGIRTGFSDDLLWLPYAVARYAQHTGDESILREVMPYLHSAPLSDDEHERYEKAQISAESDTVFGHCLRAVDRSIARLGEHGLPLLGTGDWNDALSNAGAGGRGESVWLGWFLCDVLNRFVDICRRQGDAARADRYLKARRELAAALNRHAWDERWYRRAYTDAGQWLGSVHNQECRIDAIAQSWSVISQAAPPIKALQAMQSFDRELVDRELSVARLLTPPFNNTEPSPGYIQGYPPGIRENGAQYTHGVIWSIIAWCRLKNGEKAFELFQMLNPLSHTRTLQEVRQYAGEPYVMAADVCTAAHRQGQAGWTWYTGAAGWMYQAGIEWILGLQRRGNRLYLRPCLPGEWPEFTVRYRFGASLYQITVLNSPRRLTGSGALCVDGIKIDQTEQDLSDGVFIELKDDGRHHHVTLSFL